MDRSKKVALRALTDVYVIINKHYKLYRKALSVLSPHLKPLYHLLDLNLIINGRAIQLREFRPKKDGVSKALIFFHGGGWVAGNIDSYIRICSHMAEATKHTVISVNYRLAPENPFPAGLEDCYYVTKAILRDPCLIDCSWESITLIGDSAGGNLAAAVSQLTRDNGDPIPCKQVLLYPATYFDHGERSPFPSVHENGTGYILTAERVQNYMDLYVQNEKDKCNPYVAPILADDLSNQPKTLIITAEFDPLRDEGEAYGKKLKEFGNDVTVYRMPEALHGFLSLSSDSRPVKKCYKVINDFLNNKDCQNEASKEL
ncbi:MAG: alpha/beta hydrolase [Oscillospiraceae bacterium]